MTRAILKLLLQKKAYLYLSLALLLSNIGTAFTAIAVYGELARLEAPTYLYSLAFILGLVPGLITSFYSAKWCQRFGLGKMLVTAQLVGGLLVILPLLGALSNNIWLLVLAEAIGSMIGGVLAPVYQKFLRVNFADEELSLVSIYDSYVFTAHFIFGQALGTLLFSSGIGTFNYIVFDICTYVLAALIVVYAVSTASGAFGGAANEQKSDQFHWSSLSLKQKRVFWLMPLLSLVCAPAMAVLPARGALLGQSVTLWFLTVSPALLFLLSKAIGQLLGPQVVARSNFDSLVGKNSVLIGCVSLYLLCYLGVFLTTHVPLAVALIIVAHIFSNVVFVLASYGFTKNFSTEQIADVSSRNYQASVLAMSLSALLGGVLGEVFGLTSVIVWGALMMILWICHLRHTTEGGK